MPPDPPKESFPELNGAHLRPGDATALHRVRERGEPYLVFFDEDDRLNLIELAEQPQLVVGRRAGSDIALPWDSLVSRSHAEFRKVGEDWSVSDDGISRNGTFVGEVRVLGGRRLEDGDIVRVGATQILYRDPRPDDSRTRTDARSVTPPSLTERQRDVLNELCRPMVMGSDGVPATNDELARALHLTVPAVKNHLRALYQKFALGDEPQSAKRQALAHQAMQSGLVDPRLGRQEES